MIGCTTTITAIIIMTATLFLVGCESREERVEQEKESHTIIGSVEGAKIISKEAFLRPVRYEITFEKNNQKLTLTAHSEEVFDALHKGTVADIKYSKDYHIEEIRLIELEK
jgi:hypothetical protein